MLKFENINFEWGYKRLWSRPLCGLVASGELCHIKGKNGAGKSTLLKILSGLLEPSDGIVYWQNKPIHKIRNDYCRDLFFLPHALGLKRELTASENLRFDPRIVPISSQAIDAALRWSGVQKYRDTKVALLSQGERQRVALAKLYLSPAALWILDEPVTALDQDAQRWFEQVLLDKVKTGGCVILSSHHDFEEFKTSKKIEL